VSTTFAPEVIKLVVAAESDLHPPSESINPAVHVTENFFKSKPEVLTG